MEIRNNIIPSDNSTLFISAGMQDFGEKFRHPDNSVYSTLQSCIRTTDLDQIGDGTHLSSFEMLGNFSFSAIEYKKSCEMWLDIVENLGLLPDYITCHPDKEAHSRIWQSLGQKVITQEDCVWSDGDIGGYCTEMFRNGLEIGNLVNTLEHSTDVGFGLERMLMLLENKDRVDDTSIFSAHEENFVIRDHVRTINLFWLNNVFPGNKGRNYISRTLIRRCLFEADLDKFKQYQFYEWMCGEKKLQDNKLNTARSNLRRHKNKPFDFWKETFGLTQYEHTSLMAELGINLGL